MVHISDGHFRFCVWGEELIRLITSISYFLCKILYDYFITVVSSNLRKCKQRLPAVTKL